MCVCLDSAPLLICQQLPDDVLVELVNKLLDAVSIVGVVAAVQVPKFRPG